MRLNQYLEENLSTRPEPENKIDKYVVAVT